MSRSRHGSRTDEDVGGALPICLAVTMFLGLVVVGLLQVATASVLATRQLRDDRQDRYAAEGATNIAIEYLLQDPSRGISGSPCPVLFTMIDSVAVTVSHTCTSPPDVDRVITLSAAVNGRIRSRVTVVIQDAADAMGLSTVEVVSWTDLQ